MRMPNCPYAFSQGLCLLSQCHSDLSMVPQIGGTMNTSDIFIHDPDYYGPCTWFDGDTECVGFIGYYPRPALRPYASSHIIHPRRWKMLTFDRAPASVRATW